MEFVSTLAGSIHISVRGPEDGPVVLFSNSLGTDFRIWDGVLEQLPAGLRIVRYDKRGHGLSDMPKGEWGMGDHVADAAAVMDRIGAKDGVIVGLSIGGMIAQGLAAERPDLIRGMVLCDTGAKIGTPAMWGDRIDEIRRTGLEPMAGAILERWFSRTFRNDRAGELAIWRNMLIRTPCDAYIGSAIAIRDTDLQESTSRLRLPTLAMCGAEDGVTPPDLVRETADLIPGSSFHLIKGAGHLPCIEAPVESAGLISNFLRNIGHIA
jgi:3-oxoadipate enol-lactonase